MAEIHIKNNDDLSQLRSEFAANVSHELKTPLTSIKGFADLLSSGVVSDEADRKHFVDMISVEADRMINLINDILKLSELQESVRPAYSMPSNVLQTARDVVSNLESTAAAADVTVIVLGDECTLPMEQERLRILLINLIENAIKYNKPGGHVYVSAKKSEDSVSICVSDTGIGIPPEHQPRIFERFYRVDKSRSKKTGGTGLGLAIVKHIAALYDGHITIESEPENGTSITIRFGCV